MQLYCLHYTLTDGRKGGNDVFVDIGDKGWGVLACQKYFGGIDGSKTLHVGDQFLSAGANDFKVRTVLSQLVQERPAFSHSFVTNGYAHQARSACTTAWIASPAETVHLLDEINSTFSDAPT